MSLKSELRNNIAHFFTGIIVGCVALLVFRMEYAGVIIAGIAGLSVEAYQLVGKREPWWVIDRVCDLLGYCLGGAVATFIFVYMRWV